MEMKKYEVIVVGGGHGGVEASLAAARLGKKTAMFTLYLDTIAMMSCNPSIGGPGKSNLVAEMDILGGEMGRHTDKFNLQLKHLNESKGPAARITRGQADKYLYRTEMRKILEHTDNLEIIQDCVDEIIVENGRIKGIITRLGIKYYAECVVLATGTFLKGKIVIGDVAYSAGRQGENSAEKLSDSLREHGITIERYQTATPPRLDKRSIDFSKMKELKGEEHPRYFSIFTDKERNNVVPTWLTYTTEKTIEVAKEMLQYSPIVSGIIKTHGPRHCPSLDRKVINFPDKSNHQIFLELESAESEEVYVNGLTTAMPPFAQEAMMRTIAGLENARVMRYGYAVEYDYAPAAQLYPSLESKKIEGLYFAGQINGTSGYEEAACQGFIAGVNAARKADGKEPVIIDRSEGYIGVLIDDIIHKKTPEPYRVLPSRSEYRLTLRFDNAFMRLFTKAKEIGILSSEKLDYLENSIKIVNDEIARLKEISVPMVQANALLEKLGSDQKLTKGVKIGDLLKIKEVTYDSLKDITEINDYPGFIKNQIETMIKYEIFIQRENEQIEKFKRLEEVKIPADFDFSEVKGISNIARCGLEEIKPLSIGEASRISGVTGNDIALLVGYLK
ncbi:MULTISPECIES: tRNA uridine-5-carboxymethylaminomethyl(34) synthesis enzyme MnmG [Fusobacterium]|jgi:tRNA uridine 5-carboxymethylaminomethyl modification enzyme|uniref:tRNA uridine 5-carboxymethylaminomethyl modification enzyme MnmG n=1 Tax=Fusobacterium varium ATCC 27725 TaxID=469618 RepID=A0ABN5JHY6_FUSVA|nr:MULTISPECIES: tRNA uridine-5-carboxymethylaminomethyl(34) synthesis enzyme MnmG [Fusobacterium]AVQ30579.1 tRNA uridine-5-carboxymethylaminomethyl(34) synthesis enzyme MnmG [Fusobacterium varium ATCC 27725]EES63983.1 tRNA uridine 5-carboxymethylaminomethyl modification enzyme GidA [Fusobacterium varium ATCC 27725]MCF0172021.1 tRNA uridine-5-carboxymethylaminomethyl(34) synthesis enzyme MnmG [Fusobacterium varium]MCI6032703.1 tRNA uridine-5-carboxymethylaminomethyl(34) synthesis enzyme MnmG [F